MKRKCIQLCDNFYHIRKFLMVMNLTFAGLLAGTFNLDAAVCAEQVKTSLEISYITNPGTDDMESVTGITLNVSAKGSDLINGAILRTDYSPDDLVSDIAIHPEGVLDLTSNPEMNSAGVVTNQQQTKRISGTVKDEKGEPLIGATIQIRGTTIGALTNVDGTFSLDIPLESRIITVSFVGYEPQDIDIGSLQILNITLKSISIGLEEVVVVGYGTQKKESVVGAITQIDNTAIVKSGISTVTNAISGKLSGVLNMQQSGQPGSNNSEIIIRGLSSWNSSQPLVLVDGIERDFKDIDPNEINTISVLKDASATAVFGAKGANGVILVTTKRGTLGKPKMDFSTSAGVNRATRIPEHIDSYTTLSMYNIANMNQAKFDLLIPQNVLEEYRNPSTPLRAIQYPDVNWFDLLSNRFAPNSQSNLNITGGSNFVKYFISLGHMYEGDFFKSLHNEYMDTRYSYNRFNYRSNLEFSLTKTTQLVFIMGGSTGIQNRQAGDPWSDLYTAPPCWFPAYYPEWVLDLIPDPDYPDDKELRRAAPYNHNRGNPYSNINEGTFNRYIESKFFSDISLDQKLDFILRGLSFKSKIGLSTYNNIRSLYANHTYPQYELYWDRVGTDENPWHRIGQGDEVYKLLPVDLNVGGLEPGYYKDLYYEFALNYGKTFGKHSVTALALMNRQQKNRGTDFPFYNQGFIGRATYDYNRKYLAEFNVGYTGSEQFAPGNRYGFFPSFAFGWTISEELFFKESVPWMNKLKLRYSDGLVGSDVASTRWLYTSEYNVSGNYIIEDKAPNTSAQWEQARKRDIGLEIALLKNLILINIDFFDEYRDKMLLTPRTVTYFVGNSFKDLNKGSLKKHGFEAEVEYNKIVSNNFSYFIKTIFGFNETRIIFKDDLPYSPDYLKESGKSLGAQVHGVSPSGNGYFNSIDDVHIDPAPIAVQALITGDYKFADYNADGQITILDLHPVRGSLYPPVTYSFAGGFTYRGFDFNFLFYGNDGKYVKYTNAFQQEFLENSTRVQSTHLNHWAPTNQNATHPNLRNIGKGSNPNTSWAGGEAGSATTGGGGLMWEGQTWRNADYLRLKEIYAGYTFKPAFLQKLAGVSLLNIYITGNNIFTFTDLIKDADPEGQHYGFGFYPLMASYRLGVKLSF